MTDAEKTYLLKKIFELLNGAISKGMTGTELAGRIGVSQGTVNKYMKGHVQKPDVDTLLRFKTYFRKPFSYFVPTDTTESKLLGDDEQEIIDAFHQMISASPEEGKKLFLNLLSYSVSATEEKHTKNHLTLTARPKIYLVKIPLTY